MELSIISAANTRIQEGHDRNVLQLFVEEEITDWKRRDKYRNAELTLVVRSHWEMVLKAGSEELAILRTIY